MRRIVLLVEKYGRFRRFWRRLLEKAGLEVVVISSPEEMVDTVRKIPVDFIFLGRQQRDTATLNCLRKVREFMQEVTVAAPLLPEELLKEVEAIEDFGYRADLALAPDTVRLESRTVSEFIALFHEKQPGPYRFENFIGKSPEMNNIFALMTRAVRQDVSTVLVTGETGTGKELVARALHHNGRRARQPFIDVNCSALPEQLLEGELFGYEKGAFTDAKAAKPGLMELADGGTLFLDEVSEMQPSVQAKLLRVIETRTLRRLGGVENIQVDVNVVEATNRDLRSEVASGRFREDLYHRLNVFNIALPPLRERPGDGHGGDRGAGHRGLPSRNRLQKRNPYCAAAENTTK
ncbi:MAG: sigma 54-interacting transcriptional regulator [Bacillota bacterium]